MRRRHDSIVQDGLVALVFSLILGAFIAYMFWHMTGLSPWPMVILAEIAGFGFGLAILAITAPRRRD
jgi:F0F1-type ATP synthase assembly protein I